MVKLSSIIIIAFAIAFDMNNIVFENKENIFEHEKEFFFSLFFK